MSEQSFKIYKDTAERLDKNASDIANLKEDLSNKITKFYASNQGETHLIDSDKGKIQDMFLYGKSEQVQYKGKNLLNATVHTQTINGVTLISNGDGTYTIDGTATDGNAMFTIKTGFKVIVGKTYRFSFFKSGTTNSIYLQFYNGTILTRVTAGEKNVNMEHESIDIDLYVDEGTTVNKILIKPMIVDASLYPDTTYDDYEPYTGGIPSPNPDYPQEIKAVVNPVVKVCGSNIYDYENAKASNTVLDQNGVENVSPGYTTSDYIPVLDGIYIKANNNNGKVDPLRIGLYAEKNEWKIRKDITNSTQHILSSDAKFIKLSYSKSDVAEIYVSYSNIFEPYTEQSITLPYTLYAIPVTTGGNITIGNQQYVADYVDVERGKFVRMCKKIDLGELTYKYIISEKRFLGISISATESVKTKNVICNKYLSATAEETYFNKYPYAISCSKSKMYIADERYTDGSELKNAVNGVKAYYISATPEEIDLTPEEISAFKSLSTNYPVTNIEVSSDQLDGYTVFNYPISMADGWNYVKQQIGDTRDYIYDMDLQSAEAYVNSEYAVALTELEV